MFNWSRNFGFTYTPVQISKGEHMVYSCVYFIYANELKQPSKRLVLHDWLIGTSDSLLTGFILSEFMPLCFFLLFFLFAFFVC